MTITATATPLEQRLAAAKRRKAERDHAEVAEELRRLREEQTKRANVLRNQFERTFGGELFEVLEAEITHNGEEAMIFFRFNGADCYLQSRGFGSLSSPESGVWHLSRFDESLGSILFGMAATPEERGDALLLELDARITQELPF